MIIPQSVMSAEPHNLYGFWVCVLYGVISTTITFFNKAVLSYYKFPFPFTLTLAQIVFSIVFSAVMKQLKLIDYADFSFEMLRKMLLPGILFAVQVVTGLAALVTVNVPMFGVLRRFTTFLVWIFELVFQHKRTPQQETASLIMMILGAVVAGLDDVTFEITGYILVTINCVLTAAYLVRLNTAGQETKLNSFGLLFYSNIVSLPIMLLAALGSGEVRKAVALSSTVFRSFGFQLSFFMSAILAFLLNYSIYLCTTVNSALATSVTGQIKTIATTVVGLFLFGDVVITLFNSVGLVIGVAGSLWYSYVKYKQQTARAQPKDTGTTV